MRRLQPQLAKVQGITLYMQPVQDLTVDDRVSRTQFQYTLEDPDANELNTWTAKLMTKLQALPELRDVATDQQTGGLQTSLVIDRVTASRLGITPQMIDDALYDAFGQRQISTLFTQLNQYHVVLETLPDFQKNPAKLKDIYVRSAVPAAVSGTRRNPLSTIVSTGKYRWSSTGSGSAIATAGAPIPNGGVVPLSTFAHFESRSAPLSVNHQGQFPVVTISFNLAPKASLGDATQAIDQAEKQIGMPLSIMAAFQGTAQAFQASLANEPLLILAAIVTVYIVLGVLYESYIHPHYDFVDAAVRRSGSDSGPDDLSRGTQRRGADRHHSVDRHRAEERHHDDRFRPGGPAQGRQGRRRMPSIRRACCASARSS